LRDENAIEWIAVEGRQLRDESCGIGSDGQFDEAGVESRSGNLRGGDGKVCATEPGLDSDLPNAGGAE
jgi:hypothetical protein